MGAQVQVVGSGGEPALAGVAQQAHLGAPVHQPARADMSRQEGLIELFTRVFQPRCVAAQAEPEPLSQRMLVFAAPPHGEAHARRRQVLLVAAERQPAYVDGLLVRGGADVGARRHGGADVHRPTPPRPHCALRKRLMLAATSFGGLPASTRSKCLPGQAVAAFEEERPGQFEPHAHQAGAVHQDGPKRGYGLVEKGGLLFPLRRGQAARRLDGREALEEEDIGAFRMGLDQRTQDVERLGIAAIFQQGPGALDQGVGGKTRACLGLQGRGLKEEEEEEEDEGRRSIFSLTMGKKGGRPSGRPPRHPVWELCGSTQVAVANFYSVLAPNAPAALPLMKFALNSPIKDDMAPSNPFATISIPSAAVPWNCPLRWPSTLTHP